MTGKQRLERKVLGYRSGGAFGDRTLVGLVDRQALALAYRLPKGKPCRDLAARVEAMHRLIPLAQRRWGHVRAAALCA